MKSSLTSVAAVVVFALLLVAGRLTASGPLGIYGIVDKVVFEPNADSPERMQIWGAFAYAQIGPGLPTASPAKRGFMYFRLPDAADRSRASVLKEWADLKAVAGTGQAVGFGQWGYVGGFGDLRPDVSTPYIFESGSGRPRTDLRVRPSSEAPASPSLYQTSTGIVKLPDASHSDIIKQLRAALKPESR